MAHLIDKDAVVAEIERLISNGQIKLKESEECKDYESYVALAERIATCINILSFLDTLEVKEVDLDALGVLAEHLIACDAHLVTPKYTDKELDLLEELAKNNKAQKGE